MSQGNQVAIEPSWYGLLKEEFEKPYFSQLKAFLHQEKAQKIPIAPPGNRIFAAFDFTPVDEVKVVILGQDPYHGPGQANGLCFSVNDGIPIPPSLHNIFKEIHQDIGVRPSSGNLEYWANQGVLLLNATLTVRLGAAGSHQGKGWEEFTNTVISKISAAKENLVFMLWGRFAISKRALIDAHQHLILTAAHPSPLSAHNGFFGCKHFSQCNEFLEKTGKKLINWA